MWQAMDPSICLASTDPSYMDASPPTWQWIPPTCQTPEANSWECPLFTGRMNLCDHPNTVSVGADWKEDNYVRRTPIIVSCDKHTPIISSFCCRKD